MSRPKVVGVVGPTATGKTGIAIDLAEQTGAEVVSVDSMQLYRGMDIGTAKPTPEERRRVPHHMIDVADPDDPYDARRYAADATAAIEAVHARGRGIVLVGGTGLYLRALLHGLAPAPGADPAVREELRVLAEREGRGAVHRRLQKVDPEAAARISPNDLVRMERAIESASRGVRLSEVQATHGFSDARFDAILIALHVPPAELAARIEARTRRMFEEGFVEEVRRLLARHGPGLRALGSVGYREVTQLLQRDPAASPLAETMAAVVRSTRKYAKRQRTWFRSEPGVEWVAPGDVPWNRLRAHLFTVT